ncbi:MAG: nucleotidyl transferase AbiEii/AbiGii toxin family protein [Chitinophagaceae bacterium]|nr:nucleotidyl transferase AbiEii/AbiGii toxin family protein [Chitinophagaceae bacterium]MCW5905646.1 nucleotidyl transferase AbiEii/AbiGii toxin family protein [Chitinophagaceae bacterium]
MHLSILNKEQQEQLELLNKFKRGYILVGGTAIALHIGHRRSIDFDLFKETHTDNAKIKRTLAEKGIQYQLLFENADGINLLINNVKWTFFYYPFPIKEFAVSGKYFKIPDLLTLAAMKAYALGRRSKWKDYVDLLIILENHYTIEEISKRADQIFGDGFSEKMFRVQLVYFKDIDYSEQIEWLIQPIPDKEVQNRLTKMAV